MEYAIGVILGLAIAAAATVIGFAKERSFYPTVLIVIATYYVLFAVMGGAHETLIAELLVAGGFILVAIVGYRTSLWVVAIGLVAHGIFDYTHGSLIENAGVPGWWPGFCLAIDVTLGAWLMVVLIKRSNQ
ncbi:hypothetical protein [Marinobacter adhaerens]|uniref:hypothetical protein n=1 Tax=Marinobacter adhaerens TaxID=1033846 RepID=UPI003F71594F